MARSKTVEVDIPSYKTAQALIEDQAGRIFLHLEEKSFAEVGYLFGLDRYLANEASMRSAIMRAYNLVFDNPMKYDISDEKAAFIHGKVSGRGIAKRKPETVREEQEIAKLDIATAITGSRDQAARLVRKKLDYLESNPKAFREMSLKELIGALHILFDKGQIVAGQATEHIAVMSNLDDKLDPEAALKAIMDMREELNLKKQ